MKALAVQTYHMRALYLIMFNKDLIHFNKATMLKILLKSVVSTTAL